MKQLPDSMKEKLAEAYRLGEQLDRQLRFEAKFEIKPHEIARIVLSAGTMSMGQVVKYNSTVTMKNGDEHFFPLMNVKAMLDGVDDF